jgi:hypothetical protein
MDMGPQRRNTVAPELLAQHTTVRDVPPCKLRRQV